jgi:hypothetical protein
VFSPDTWPSTAAWPSRAVLLDLDPWFIKSKRKEPDLPPARISEHRWPSDAIGYARSIGLNVQLDDRNIPWVGPDALADRPNVFLHDLVLGFVDPLEQGLTEQGPTPAEWQALREQIHRTHIRTLRRLPQGCVALHYFTEGDMSFLLATSTEMVQDWIDSLLYSEFPHLAAAIQRLGIARTPLAAWILEEGKEIGVRLESVDVNTDAREGPTIHVKGKWGKDSHSLAIDIGSLDDDSAFDASLPLR